MLFYDSLFEYFDLISQFIYLKVFGIPPSLPPLVPRASAWPCPAQGGSTVRQGQALAQPHPRTPPPRDLDDEVAHRLGRGQGVSGPRGQPRRAAAGRVAKGRGQSGKAKASCMLDPWPPKVAGSTSRIVAEPTAPSAVSATLLCRGGERRQPGKAGPFRPSCAGDSTAGPSPDTCSPRPSAPLLAALAARPAQGRPLASASPKEAGAGHPQARQHASAKTCPSPAVLRPWGWTGALRRGGDPREPLCPGLAERLGRRAHCFCSSLGPRAHHLCSQLR